MKLGYIRVSADDQNPDLQRIALKKIDDIDQVLEDQESGTVLNRGSYQWMCIQIEKGFVESVFVWKMDRLGRDPIELISFFNLLDRHGVEFHSITEPHLTDWNKTPAGYLTWWLQIGLTRFELLQLKERQRAGIDAARRAGKHLGRPRKDES